MRIISFAAVGCVLVAPSEALTGVRPDTDSAALLLDDPTTFVEVGRIGASTVSSASAIEPSMDIVPDGFLSARNNTDSIYADDQPILDHWWSPNSMAGQFFRFLLAAGFLFAEMMMIFVILAGIEYSLCWWKPHIFRRTIRLPGAPDMDGTMTTRPDNPADRMGSYLVTPNLHEHVHQHNSKRIRMLKAGQEVEESGKSNSRVSLAPATAA